LASTPDRGEAGVHNTMTDTPVSPAPSDARDSRPGLEALLFGFSRAVDRRQPEAVADFFTAEGVFRPGDNAVRGRDSIGAFYQDRLSDPRRVTRHQWANIQIQPLSAHEARLTALLTTYAIEPKVSLTDLQVRIGDVDCLCQRQDDGVWRFAEHLYTRAFTASLPLSAPAAPSKDIRS
jgi:uncharacterized protein (TIGR02246 family)